jgi:hypothetical protein
MPKTLKPYLHTERESSKNASANSQSIKKYEANKN